MSYRQQHLLIPNSQSIDELARLIWSITQKEQVTPIVVLSTSGPALGLRKALNQLRPNHIEPHLVFLPRVLGLKQWLSETLELQHHGVPKTDLARWMEVYQALSARPQLRSLLSDATEGSKWALSKNLINACDLIAEASLGIKEQDAEKALADAINEVYQGAAKLAIDVETKILLTFWENLSTIRDPVARQRHAMALRAKQAQQFKQTPLVYVETAKGSPGFESSLADFLEAYATHTPVHHCAMDFSSIGLWPECLGDASHATSINQEKYLTELAGFDRQIIKSQSFEDAAWAGALAIQDLMKAGKSHLALISQDRLVARRIRALLARLGPGLSVHDETGWKLSTTRAASALMSWVDILREGGMGPSAVTLLEFLKNPYIKWSDWGLEGSEALGLIQRIENRFIQSGAQGGWLAMLLALNQTQHDQALDGAINCLTKLRQLTNQWQCKPQSCGAWLNLLMSDLDVLAMTEQLSLDIAGQQLLDALKPMHSVEGDTLHLAEWLSLLGSVIEDSSYIESCPRESTSVTIMPLSATRLRHFDAWVMVGCDDGQLPSLSDSPMFLSSILKKIIGCKSVEAEFAQQAMDLSQLMMSHSSWRMIWQSRGSTGEPRQPSAWLQRLYASAPELLNQTYAVPDVSFDLKPVNPPAVSLPSDFVKPSNISPSGYKALRECPYRYYASRLLGLREQTSLDAEVDLSLVGQTLHAALKSFHHGLKSNPIQGDQTSRRGKLVALLKDVSLKHFQALLNADGRWLAAWVQWESQIPDWIDWQLKREEDGWIFHDGEITVGFDLPTDHGSMRVSGNVDRIDVHPVLGAAVIDYKYSSEASIKLKQKNIEDDPQLLIYANAIQGSSLVDGAKVHEASWVSIKESQVELSIDNLEDSIEKIPSQMRADIDRVWSGDVLKASAPDSVCQYCQVRGLCRKGMWS